MGVGPPSAAPKLVQAILPASDVARSRARCCAPGFRHITRLQYLRHHLVDLAPLPVMPALRVQLWAANLEAVLSRKRCSPPTKARSIVPNSTAFAPSTRSSKGIALKGFGGRNGWWLAWVDDMACPGVALLTELFDQGGWDLSYVGVVPQMRRARVGAER